MSPFVTIRAACWRPEGDPSTASSTSLPGDAGLGCSGTHQLGDAGLDAVICCQSRLVKERRIPGLPSLTNIRLDHLEGLAQPFRRPRRSRHVAACSSNQRPSGIIPFAGRPRALSACLWGPYASCEARDRGAGDSRRRVGLRAFVNSGLKSCKKL